MFNIICTPYDQVISVEELFCVGDSIWRQLKMAAKLKTVKITYGELENIVERKSENKPNSHQKDKINGNKSTQSQFLTENLVFNDHQRVKVSQHETWETKTLVDKTKVLNYNKDLTVWQLLLHKKH